MLGDISYHKATLQSKGKHSIHYSLLTVYDLDRERLKRVNSIYQTVHCFTPYTLFLTCQANKNTLVLLISIALPSLSLNPYRPEGNRRVLRASFPVELFTEIIVGYSNMADCSNQIICELYVDTSGRYQYSFE